jgi:hypothetical protein
VRRRATLRGSFLEELFRATEEGPPGEERARPLRSRTSPSVVAALGLVALLALAALALSTWTLMRNETQTVTVPTHVIRTTATTAAPAEPAATVAPVRLAVTAARGDCWIDARAGSAAGKVIFAATLTQGHSLHFRRKRLWLSVGAGANLDVRLNGRPVAGFPSGTATVVVSAGGVSAPL